MSTHSAIDARGREVLEDTVVDVASAKTEGWGARVDIVPAMRRLGRLTK